jgi:hypothetical protein
MSLIINDLQIIQLNKPMIVYENIALCHNFSQAIKKATPDRVTF